MALKKRSEQEARTGEDGRFAYEGLDRVIHERARLGVLTALVTNRKGLTWNELKTMCSLTDGNLSRHLGILEGDGLVVQEKGESGNRPQTVVKVTPEGKKRYVSYLKTLEQVVKDAAAEATGRKLGFARG
ncbi:transcriptional regulator [Terriglobus aquaticus]|uniref:Transcriptional regulator n=1 Tax=Terriglobus aquaticus TaxID=940139 RepID=A0ABW9KMX5_9BACT|nr:transcriptional regulator [Terriglobus aquaticus]